VYKERIFSQIMQLLNMAAVPVLTGVTLEMSGIENVELYPFPIPDLFMGAPLTIAGHYKGRFPDKIKMNGLMADGRKFEMEILSRASEVIPVSKVFLKQRIDLLTARAWFEESKSIQDQVVDISCQESMPSAYTMMVAFETTEEKKNSLLQDSKDDGDEPLIKKGGDEKMSSQERAKLMAQAKQKWYKNPKTIAALAVGNAVLIGAAVFSFGDIAASVGNLPVIGSLGDGIFGALDGSCCDACGNCDCDCGDCLAC